ncbi:MAG TPA: ABC transporter substrate-binding protein [Bradyrhizobium sp.]|nr:ABC transporter substrate-binding protein [Bradyrhizobium sp.]
MKRREFIAGLGAAAGSPFILTQSSRAQQSPVPVVGFLSSRSPAESTGVASAFRQGLGEAGFVAGQNVAIDYRWAEGNYDRLPALATELVGLRVAAILAAGGSPSALAAKKATSKIPIIFSAVDDPIGVGLVESLSRPGGNVTGMSVFASALVAKRLGLLHELVPSAKTIAYLTNSSIRTTQLEVQSAQEAAKALGVDLQVLSASNDQEIEAAFAGLTELKAGAIVVAGEPFLDSRRAKVVALAAKHAVPASYGWRENVELGGLLSYGSVLKDSYRNAGIYCGRILKGEKPADLPVMQPTKFELTINLKTAKALGLTVPAAILTGADEVIE